MACSRTALAVAMLLMAGCGGSTDNSQTPAGPSVDAPVQSATITISSSGSVSPKSVTLAPGGQVTFVNNDSRTHQMYSDPHPEHTNCPELDQVGFLAPGQSRQSGNLNIVRSCGFHDHELPLATSLQGTIVIR